MQTEEGASVARIAGQDMQQHLTRREARPEQRGQDRHPVVRRLRPAHHGQHRTDGQQQEPRPLQQAERTGKLAEQDLVGESDDQNGGNREQREDIEKAFGAMA